MSTATDAMIGSATARHPENEHDDALKHKPLPVFTQLGPHCVLKITPSWHSLKFSYQSEISCRLSEFTKVVRCLRLLIGGVSELRHGLDCVLKRLCIVLFEDCSAFTRVAACTHSRCYQFVTR
jgi:hypothetical protein